MRVLDDTEIVDKMNTYFDDGGGKTFYCGYNSLSRHYNIKEGGVTDWTGNPGSGKTELLLDILTNCSKWYGHKHLIYMPDVGSEAEVVAQLIKKKTGKEFQDFYYDKAGTKIQIKNKITQSEMLRVIPEITENFKIFSPTEGKKSKSVTPKEFWDFAAANKKELGIFSAVIDSWNHLTHDIGSQRQDQWLEEVLSYRNELAEKSNLHFHTIIHPKTEKKDKNGKKLMPDMHSLKGGSEWPNNGKTIIVVDRGFDSHKNDIVIEKAKPKIVGIRGATILRFDITKGCYYENINGVRYYAHKDPVVVEKKPKVDPADPDERIESSSSNDELDDLPF